MKHRSITAKGMLFIFLFSLVAFSQSELVAVRYPYLIVAPETPQPEDDVRIQIQLGEASNACMAPRFTDLDFTIAEVSDNASEPPQYNVYVSFTRVIDSNKVCTMIYDPVDYGPIFALGKLKPGQYQVIDRLSGSQVDKIYGSFAVGEAANVVTYYTVKGTVYDDPAPLDIASRPLEGAMVYLRPRYPTIATDASADRMIAPVTTDSVKTDENGNFVFTRVLRGVYLVSIVHREYNSVTDELSLSSDTTLRYIMTPVDASASIHGKIYTYSWESAVADPVPGCTVTVSTARIDLAASGEMIAVPRLQAVTAEDGTYRIEDIPVDYNGQVWYVNVKKNELQGSRTVRLSNLADVEVSFSIMKPYANASGRKVDGIEYKIMTDRRRYLNRETVKIRYSITNTTEKDVEFGPFSGGCEYDLIVSTYNSADDKDVYRASDHPICLDVESYITIPAGETVVHDFPEYVLPDLRTYLIETNTADAGAMVPVTDMVRLMFTGRLRGEKYDSSEVTVAIEVEIDPPPVAVEMKSAKIKENGAHYDRNSGLLQLDLADAQNIAVEIHTLNGASIAKETLSRYYSAGSHALSLRNVVRSSGMFIIRIRGEKFVKNIRAVKLAR